MLVRTLIAVGLLGSAACGSDSTGPTDPAAVTGTYNLSTIDGSSLPAPIPENVEVVVDACSLTLTLSTSHFESAYTITCTITSDGGAPFSQVFDGGTYSRLGSTVTFTSTMFNNLTYTLATTSTKLTATVPGPLFLSTDPSIALVFIKMS